MNLIPKKWMNRSAVSRPDAMRLLIASAVFFVVFLFFHFNVLERFELVTYDYRFLMKGSRPTDSRIVVIEIPDDSIQKIGRWPWGRDWHATLIQALKSVGAKAVVFDVLFSEHSDPQKDTALSNAIREAGNVYLAEVVEKEPSGKVGLLTSLPEFREHAKGSGHINLVPDRDGVMRRIPLFVQTRDAGIPQLSLSVALDEMGAGLQNVRVKKRFFEIERQDGKIVAVPLDMRQNLVINWAGRWNETFRHFSFVDVVRSYALGLKGEKPPFDLGVFKDKICFVGTTASGLFDIRPTPLEPSYPAVGVNLTVLDDLLSRRFVTKARYWEDLMILLGLFIFLFPALRFKNYLRSAVAVSFTIVGYALIAIAAFYFFDVWINLVYPELLIVNTYFFVTIYNQLSVAIERSKLLKLATRDSLTGLYNIGHFKLLLKAEIATVAIRKEKKLSLIIGDIDNFKSTNDRYGHVTGDTVLKEVANAFKTNCRALDVAGRYGGEEFVLMLPGANADEAVKVADKIRKSVNEKLYFHPKGDFKTSVSIGVTRISPEDKDIDAIVARADRALYEAKQTGKNKVVLAGDSPALDG